MKYTYKKPKKFQLISLLSVGWLVLLLIGCDNNIQNGNIDSEVGFFEYELDNGVLNVILDSEHVHKSQTFATEEEFVSRSAALEQSGEITLNPVLWNELSHYFDPVEISLLDMDRSIVVDGRKYTAGPVAIYSMDITTEGTEPRLEVYYGEDGEEDTREIALIHANRLNLEELASYDFKDPFARERYKEFVELQKAQHSGDPLVSSVNTRPSCGSSCDYRVYDWRDSGSMYEVKYRGSASGPVHTAHMRWYIYNESYSKGIIGTKYRSRGGTYTEIDRLHDGQGWRGMPDDASKIGQFHENGTQDTSTPKTNVHVIPVGRTGKTKEESKWQVYLTDVGRDSGSGTHSRHSAWVRYNNSNSATQVMFSEFVD